MVRSPQPRPEHITGWFALPSARMRVSTTFTPWLWARLISATRVLEFHTAHPTPLCTMLPSQLTCSAK